MPKELAKTKPSFGARQRAQFNEVELELIARVMEHQPKAQIEKDLGLTTTQLDKILNNPTWKAEYDYQLHQADRQVRGRLERLSSEALDVVREIMRSAASPAYRLRAALEILDRAGHIKVEKRITYSMDAEQVIKHLNQLGEQPAAIDVEGTEVGPGDEYQELVENIKLD